MRRIDVDVLSLPRVDPVHTAASTWKDKGVNLALVDDAEPQVLIRGRASDRNPVESHLPIPKGLQNSGCPTPPCCRAVAYFHRQAELYLLFKIRPLQHSYV